MNTLTLILLFYAWTVLACTIYISVSFLVYDNIFIWASKHHYNTVSSAQIIFTSFWYSCIPVLRVILIALLVLTPSDASTMARIDDYVGQQPTKRK